LLGKAQTSVTQSEREREFLKVKQELDAARRFAPLWMYCAVVIRPIPLLNGVGTSLIGRRDT